MKGLLKIIFINLFVLLALLEIVAVIYIKSKDPVVYSYAILPTYLDFSWADTYDTLNDPLSPKTIDTAYAWCTWHPKNRVHRQVAGCFDVTYQFNEYGARGPAPDATASNTVFFVGDSFTEGFGIAEDSTLSERMREMLKQPVINLGSSGDIGPTQMSLIYKTFARQLKHSDVYVLFYLNNDFSDNDIANHDAKFKNRYRPYRVLVGSDSSNIVYRGSIDSTKYSWSEFNRIKEEGFVRFRRYGLKNYFQVYKDNLLSKLTKLTYTRRLVAYLTYLSRQDAHQKPAEFNFNVTDWKKLEMDIADMKNTAALHEAKIYFINLPSRNLLSYARAGSEQVQAYKKLETNLQNLIEGPNARYISFYDYLLTNSIDDELLFLSCDNHYSNYGNARLADFIRLNR